MKKLYILILCSILSVVSKAQTAASYGFNVTSGTFTSIVSSGTSTTAISSDDAVLNSISIGFNFDFCGVTYNTLAACSNGWLSLANTSDYGWVNTNTTVDYYAFPTPGAGLLMGYWDDLSGSGRTAYYSTTGSAPNRVFTFEWTNWASVSGSGNGNFQIKLYETSNVIEYCYGSSSYSGHSATIGIANSTSDYKTVDAATSSPTPSSSSFIDTISVQPASGLVYRWTPPGPCSGTPTAGTAVSSTGTACPSSPFTVSLSGTTSATGLTYQWQSSSDSITWTSISGETNNTATLTEGAATYYRCIVYCASASTSDTSSFVLVNYIGACYCTPYYYGAYAACAYYNLAIANFHIVGESGTYINDAAACTTTGYQDMTATSVSLMQGASYATTISNGGTANYSNLQAWVDYNDNGTFESSETVGGASSFLTATYTTAISASAPLGSHRMRVVLVYDGEGYAYPTMDPCTYGYYYGEARDYTVNIVPMPPCSGTPTAGTVAVTGAPACPSSTIGLSLSGATVATGLTYQWESSSDSSTWTSISGATNATLSTTESAATYFRCIITCTASAAADTTPGAYVRYIYACYCTSPVWYSESSYSSGYAMDALSITGYSGSTLNDASMIAATPSTGYLDRTLMTPVDLQQGGTYTGSVNYGTSSTYMETQAWIDYNNNGTFENSELVINPVAGFSATSYTSGTAITLNLPITAPVGNHRMRVRCAWLQTSTYSGSVSNPMDPCAMCDAEVCYWSGNVVDYTVNIVALPACTGTPTAGTVNVTGAPACPSSTIGLSLTGSTMASAINYQWQSSSDSSTWTNISGATSNTLATTETAATYFRCILTCTTSSASDTSAGVLVPYISGCYCIPSYYSATWACAVYNLAISDFEINGESGTSISDATGCSGSGYQNMTSMSVDLMQGASYATSISNGGTANYSNAQAWIDFNDNGTFESSESVGGATSFLTTTYTTLIPASAPLGAHRMRLVFVYDGEGYSYPTLDPCTYGYTYGEGRDYTVNIVPMPPCSGTPTAGTVAVTGAPACPSSTIGLSLTGATVASGLAYQWESSSDSSTWTSISGATNATLSTTESAATYFRCIITCITSSASDTTPGAYVRYVYACYCTTPTWYSESSYASGYAMDALSITGYSGSTLSDASIISSTPATGYLDRTTMTPVDLQQGGSYSGSVSYGTSSNYMETQAWIDYNNNGTFENSEVVINPVAGFSTSTATSGTAITLNIPTSAPAGNHRMRVRCAWLQVSSYSGSVSNPMDPCAMCDAEVCYWSGDVVDYTVNIVALPACTGTPTAGTVLAAGAPACPSSTFTVSLSGTTAATGLAYQWQSSSDSSTWTSISGATNPTYTGTESAATYFRCIVTCTSASASDTSAGLLIRYISACYCTPYYYGSSSACSMYYLSIANFHIVGESGTTINDVTGCTGSGYQNLTSLSVTLMQGNSYTTSISNGGYVNYSNAQAWIDYNDNGTFEATETVGGATSFLTTTYTTAIPLTAAAGAHRMRLVFVYDGEGYSYPTLDPCTYGYYYGEARDYTANIIPLPPCSGTPTAGIALATGAPACPSSTIALRLSGTTVAAGLTYQWQSSSDSTTWTSVGGATNATYSTTESASTYFRCIVTCTSASASDTSSNVFVRFISSCYCTPSYYGSTSACSSYYLAIAQFRIAGEASTTINDVAPCTGSGYQNFSSLSVTLMQGNTYNTTVSNGGYANLSDAQAWIDFNDNGSFESSESVGGANAFLTTTYTTAIPLGATTGSHAMRVVFVYDGEGYTYPTLDPCTAGYYYGEARDYTVNIIPLPPCSGAPVAGSVVGTGVPACPSSTIALSLSGATSASGLTYQWQTSSDSTTWTSVSGATNTTFSTTESASTYYRCIVTCTTSSASSNTAAFFVPYVSGCYCIPSYYSSTFACGLYNLAIANFHVNGESSTYINDVAPCTGSGYQNFYYLSVDLMEGSSYTTTISNGGTVNYSNAQVWIDFNDNGTFESTETVGGATSFLTTTFSMAIPTSAALGRHMMRVVLVYDGEGYSYPTMDPCTYGYYYGEARDYTANIIPIACTGTPTAGTISASSTSSCTSFTPTITATGYTSGASNPLYWQMSSDSTTWTTVSGATSATYSPTISSGTVYYRFADSCTTTGTVDYTAGIRFTVNTTPSLGAITGPSSVCTGASITLADTAAGGSWSSSSTTLATVSAGGVVYGLSAGTDTIYYSATNGCGTTTMSRVITVLASPNAGTITGGSTVCVAATLTLSTTGTGGTWSATNTRASVSGGVVTGVTAGVDTIVYTVTNSCGTATASQVITINPLPNAGTISGVGTVCVGFTNPMSVTATGGTWSTTNTTATISTSGVVTGVALGVDTVVYTVTNSCGTATSTFAVSVNAAPSAGSLSGSASVCEAATTTITPTVTGGTWSVTNSFATVSGGVVTGVSAGVDTVLYTVTSSCGSAAAMHIITVNPLPMAGSVTASSTTICEGATTTISTSGTAGGSWSAYPASVATITSSTGVLTGVGGGSVTVSYTMTNACGSATATGVFTVTPLPHAGYLSGPSVVCEAAYISLVPGTGGGSWYATNGNATVSGGTVGGISAGVDTIIYVMTNSCGVDTVSRLIAIAPLPVAGTLGASTTSICAGDSILYTPTVGGGSWSTGSTLIATVSPAGMVHAVGAGTSYVFYTVTNSCGSATASMPVTVNALPVAGTIAGSSVVCVGSTATLTATGATTGGTWSSSSTALASVDAYGSVYGNSAGSVTITYTVTNGCGTSRTTHAVTVNPMPYGGTISGPTSVCSSANITLSRTGGSGTGSWHSATPANASVGAATGVVTGGTAGTAIIEYIVSGPCGDDTARYTITVNALPAAGTISGASVLCENTATTLTNPTGTAGGVWTSSNASIATVSTGGVVTGTGSGAVTITYTAVTASCGNASTTRSLTVSPAPRAGVIAGPVQLCPGITITLTDTATGGVWASTNAHTTHAGGVITGVTIGIDTITYTVTNSCGSATATRVVSVLPVPTGGTISGVNPICAGGGIDTLTSTEAGGTWSSSSSSVAVVNPATGVVTGISAGTARITYTVTNLCGTGMAYTTYTVSPLVTPAVTATASPGTSICDGTVVNFTANPVNGGTSPSYIWYKGSVYMGTGSTMGYVPTNGDVVKVTMTSNANCITTTTVNSPALTISAGTEVTPSVTITASPNDSVAFLGQTINFTATAVNGGASPVFAWYLNGALQAGSTSATFSHAFYSNQTVYCELVSSSPCVTEGSEIVPSNLISIYADYLGVQQVNQNNLSLQLFPNPNEGSFTVMGTTVTNEEISYNILDVTGRVLMNGTLQPVNGKVKAEIIMDGTITAGNYQVRFQSGSINQIIPFVKMN